MTVIRKRISREEGVAAVEFAIILPVLALILFGVIEFGRVWSQYQLFQGAAREGARCAAVASTSDCDPMTEVQNAAEPFTPEPPISISLVNGAPRPDGCEGTDRGQDIQVSWEQPLQIEIPFWKNTTVTSTIKAVFRCE
ncbi:MAG TPA: TadE family protein [Actinomycetota bacterium]